MVALSIVWSIIAGIIEKRKKAAARSASTRPDSKQVSLKAEWKADPVQVKIESLRRRGVSQSARVETPPTEPRKTTSRNPIQSLHRKECPLPSAPVRSNKEQIPAAQIAELLQNKRNIRTAIVLTEIISKPVSQRSS